MTIKIMSKAKAIAQSYKQYDNDKVIISISDPFDNQAKFNTLNKSIREILYLSFYDISEESKDIFNGYSPMVSEDAKKIADFVNKWEDKVDEIWVHCECGVSRSSGIAMAIMEHLDMDLTPILESTEYYPNVLCYKLTAESLKRIKEKEHHNGISNC